MEKLILILTVFIGLNCSADEFDQFFKNKWELSKTQKKYFLSHNILTDSVVKDSKNQQTFSMRVTALHKQKCKKVIRKLSLYESYAQWISFIKKSTYQTHSKLLTIHADHPLLPFPMLVHIIVDRPTKEGQYKFMFPTGIFTGLTGTFTIKEIDKKCMFFAQSYWEGKDTKIPSIVIEIFSETLSKMGGEILMRKVR